MKIITGKTMKTAPPKRSPEEIAEMRELASAMRKEGRSHQEIADELGIAKSSVWIYLPPEPGSMSEEAVMRMRSMRYDEGMNNSQIAEIMGVSRQRVSQVLGPITANPAGEHAPRFQEVRLPIEAIPFLRDKARELGYINTRGVNAMEGSIPALVTAIMRGEIALVPIRGR